MDATIKAVQLALIKRGYSVGNAGADGIAGRDTWTAIKDALGIDDPKEAALITSPAGRKAIRQREDERLNAYQDSVGIWTIGVGHTSAAGAPAVTRGLSITADQSDAILSRDLVIFENGVREAVKVPLNQNQFDALVSLAFNIGVGAFSKSTLVKKLNAGDYAGAADQFALWNKAGGKVLPGLTTRRLSEQKQFLTP